MVIESNRCRDEVRTAQQQHRRSIQPINDHHHIKSSLRHGWTHRVRMHRSDLFKSSCILLGALRTSFFVHLLNDVAANGKQLWGYEIMYTKYSAGNVWEHRIQPRFQWMRARFINGLSDSRICVRLQFAKRRLGDLKVARNFVVRSTLRIECTTLSCTTYTSILYYADMHRTLKCHKQLEVHT